jgi:hypothetical protein
MKWQEFETLYAHSAERLQLLNRVAPHFFWQQQATMWEDILLSLARITDPPRSVGRDNLTIQALDQIMPGQALAQEVRDLVAVAVSSCGFAKDWRNRRLAHNDLDLKLNQAAAPLAPANRRGVRDALDSIGQVLGRIHRYYYPKSEIVFSPLGTPGGADALIVYLQHAVQAEEQRNEQRRRQLQMK